ncbi:hypothetical protein OKN36_09660 [Furfurilactobacillus sp. OKN36]
MIMIMKIMLTIGTWEILKELFNCLRKGELFDAKTAKVQHVINGIVKQCGVWSQEFFG